MSDNFKEESGLYISQLNGISLDQFISFRSELCRNSHRSDCKECSLLINVAVDILHGGVCEVSKLYKKHFTSTYRSSNAVRRFMQLPVVVFRVGQKIGMQKLYVVEKEQGIDYKKVATLIEKFTLQPNLEVGGIGRDTLLALCKLASTESDRKLIKFAGCEASNCLNKKAENRFGIQNISKLKEEVKNALEISQNIRKEVADLAMVREKSVLRCLGLYEPCESDSSILC